MVALPTQSHDESPDESYNVMEYQHQIQKGRDNVLPFLDVLIKRQLVLVVRLMEVCFFKNIYIIFLNQHVSTRQHLFFCWYFEMTHGVSMVMCEHFLLSLCFLQENKTHSAPCEYHFSLLSLPSSELLMTSFSLDVLK